MSALHPHVGSALAHTVQSDRVAAASRRRPAAGASDLAQLLETAIAGDEEAWSVLVARFSPRLLRLARAHGLNRQEAEDAVQDTWMRLLRHVDAVREPKALGGWLATTARRESLRVRERAQRERPTDEELQADVAVAGDYERELGAAERRAAVAAALDVLPPRHRRLIRALFADTEPSYHDVATQLGMPIGSIGPIRGRCLAQLRRNFRLREAAELLD
jgi:RNA polymerase sigma factor (sigma-70 family)